MDNSIHSTDRPDSIGPYPHPHKTFRQHVRSAVNTFTTKEGLIGDYDYASLVRPDLPFMKKIPLAMPFFGLNDKIPVCLAVILGVQHALAMLGGVITPPKILAQSMNLDTIDKQYLVSSGLIVCGILSAVQITRFHIYKTPYYIGTGVISMVGVSFSVISIATKAVDQMYSNGFCPTSEDGTKLPCPDAYGAFLGTSACCALVEVVMAFIPPSAIRRIFPPIVTGPTVMLIGASLLQNGFEDWAGGSSDCMSRPASGMYSKCPTVDAPHALPWGSAEFIGLGFSVYATIILCERFGAPIMKSCAVIIGLLVGCIIAAACGYFDRSGIDESPVVSFIWVRTFKMQVYGPLVLPLIAVFILCACEAVGDVTATCDVSRLDVHGELFDSRIQGCILSDGLGCVFAALATMTPMTTFAQNNGVIALTRCANSIVLIIAGIFAKFAAAIVSIPDPVMGGMTSFLYSSVLVSGLAIVAKIPFNRRNRFIFTASLCMGYGATLVPNWFTYVFGQTDNKSLQGFFDAIVLVLETGFAVTAFVAMILHNVMPDEIVETSAVDVITPAAPAANSPDPPHLNQNQYQMDRFDGK